MKVRMLALGIAVGFAVVAAAGDAPVSPLALGRIDAHVHFFAEAQPVLDLMERANLTAVNICVVDRYEAGYEAAAPQHRMARHLAAVSHGRLPWIATFDDAGFAEPGFAARVLGEIDAALGDGALGVKIYKSIGMELRSAKGAFILPDDPAFAPILEGLAARGRILYAHLAEPIAAWQPLDPKSPDYDYYSTRAAWHVYGRPGMPSKEVVLAARDRMLEQHPRLQVVGCHLGSMEEDVDDIARRLDRYPNLAVDTAARVAHLMLQPRDKVRAFLIRYQDRVLYGTDFEVMPGHDPDELARRLEGVYAHDWAYFATDRALDEGGRAVEGLALPEPVLRRIIRENALNWIPGLGDGHH
jgi:predicted TIM-barrel fold metal-dependent hydrolase